MLQCSVKVVSKMKIVSEIVQCLSTVKVHVA